MAVLWGLRPSAPAKAFTTLRVRVRINQKCMFFYIFGSRLRINPKQDKKRKCKSFLPFFI